MIHTKNKIAIEKNLHHITYIILHMNCLVCRFLLKYTASDLFSILPYYADFFLKYAASYICIYVLTVLIYNVIYKNLVLLAIMPQLIICIGTTV